MLGAYEELTIYKEQWLENVFFQQKNKKLKYFDT